MEIGIQDGETVAHDRDRWKQVCVLVMGFNGLYEAKEEKKII